MRQDINEAISKSIDVVARFVVPIYTLNDRKPELLGSGFLIDVGISTVLVSAAHVLASASDNNPIFSFSAPNEVYHFRGKRYLSPEDGLDLGFVVLENTDLPWVGVEKYPCKTDYLWPCNRPRSDRQLLVVGYPASKNRFNPKKQATTAVPHAYHAKSVPDDQYARYGLDTLIHVALPLDLKSTVDENGRHRNFPSPNGMSGAPIWELFSEHESSTSIFPIIGVATNYRRKERLLFGTDISYLVEKLESSL